MASWGLVLPKVFPLGTLLKKLTQTKTSADDGGENVITAELSDGTKSTFTIRNGSKGDTGKAAGFAAPTAEVDNNTGTPSVEVTASGEDTAKKFHFAFKNMKGEKGAQGEQGIQGEKGAKGDKGDKGDDGASLVGVTQTKTSADDGGENVIEMTLADGSKSTFTIRNGNAGKAAVTLGKKLDALTKDGFISRTGIEPKALDTVTQSGMYPVHYPLHQGALFVFAVHGSVGIVQFLKTDYNGYTRWQYRNAIDSDTKRWTEWETIATQKDLDNFRPNGMKDFGDPSRTIQLGFAGSGLTAATTSHLAGFYNDGNGDRGYKIRDISDWEVLRFLKLEEVDNTPDAKKNVFTAEGIRDFGDPAGKHTIRVGFAGHGLTAETTSHLVGFYNDGKGDYGNKIRDISAEEVQKFLKLTKKDIIDTVYPIGIVIHAASGLNPEQAFEGTKWRYVGVVINLNEWQRLA